ncbi:MAG: hypothetical protein RRY95_07785 [Oscillospiraceae bacterium]
MESVLLYEGKKPVGELRATREALYTDFEVICHSPPGGVYRAFAVGERGRLSIGILEPTAGVLSLRRRLSQRLVTPVGQLLRGEVTLCFLTEGGEPAWKPLTGRFFRRGDLQSGLRGAEGALWREGEDIRYLALPFAANRPFLFTELFCFAKITAIEGRDYAVFAFDRNENPTFAGRD